jgi:hypothetical protein
MRFTQRRVRDRTGQIESLLYVGFGNVSFVNGLKKTFFASWRGHVGIWQGVCGGGAF